jgi:hypothetical protein
LKFEGNGINPKKLNNKEIAKMLIAFEDSIMPIFYQENPEISTEYSSSLAFHDIGYRSLSIRNAVKEYKQELKAAFSILLLSLSTGSSEGLPKQSKKALKSIVSFTNKYSCSANYGFADDNKIFTALAEVQPFSKKKFNRFIEAKTFFGKFVKLDVENLKAYFRLINGNVIKTDLGKSQIENFRELLNEEVKIKGKAMISSKTLKITSFELEELQPHKLYRINESISEIREIIN